MVDALDFSCCFVNLFNINIFFLGRWKFYCIYRYLTFSCLVFTDMFLVFTDVCVLCFQMYADGRLMFCDHIFNGYGNARKDFMKQIMKCRLDSIQGFCLPKDFRFRSLFNFARILLKYRNQTLFNMMKSL